MFMLNGKSLGLDVPFKTPDGTQYPANWLRNASLAEKVAIGISEVADPAPYDDRFYWGVNNPKDVDMVKEMLSDQVKATAYSLLSPTDYKLVRKVETGEDVDTSTLTFRTAVRTAYADNSALVQACTTTAELAALTFTWPTP